MCLKNTARNCLYFLICYPSWLFHEPRGVGILGHMFCPLVVPALRISCEDVSAAWCQAGTPACWPWVRLEGQVLCPSRVKQHSLPGSLAEKEIFARVGSLSWWEGEKSQLFLFFTFTSDCQRNFSGVREFVFVLYLNFYQTLSGCPYFCV